MSNLSFLLLSQCSTLQPQISQIRTPTFCSSPPHKLNLQLSSPRRSLPLTCQYTSSNSQSLTSRYLNLINDKIFIADFCMSYKLIIFFSLYCIKIYYSLRYFTSLHRDVSQPHLLKLSSNLFNQVKLFWLLSISPHLISTYSRLWSIGPPGF